MTTIVPKVGTGTRNLRLARWFTGTALILFAILFAVLWGPFYLFRSEGQLVLYPLALLVIPLISGLAIASVVFSILGLADPSEAHDYRPRLVTCLVIGAVLVIVPLPTLWFGNAPVLLLSTW